MVDIERRRVEAAGETACLWHLLDKVLKSLCEARDGLEEAGCDELAGELEGVIDGTEVLYDGAGRGVARLLGEEAG